MSNLINPHHNHLISMQVHNILALHHLSLFDLLLLISLSVACSSASHCLLFVSWTPFLTTTVTFCPSFCLWYAVHFLSLCSSIPSSSHLALKDVHVFKRNLSLKCAAQETFLLIINVKNSCAASYFSGNYNTFPPWICLIFC